MTGWLITGRVGCGKSISAMHGLMVAVFKASKDWGGLVIDDNSSSWQRLQATAEAHGRGKSVVILRASDSEFGSPVFNLVGNRNITWDTYGKIIMETATALGQKGDQSFFRTQAQTQISKGLEALHLLGKDVVLTELHRHILTSQGREEMLAGLKKLTTTDAIRLVDHFENEFLNQPAEQLGGVLGTLSNVLSPYTAPPIARTFCRPGRMQMDALDEGTIIGLAIDQKYSVQRLYVCTFMKQLYYHHVFSRYDLSPEARRAKNLLLLWVDEAQKFVTTGLEGGDERAVDRLREAKGSAIFATQSITSLVPPLGSDIARVLGLNLCNRVVLAAATEEDAIDAANFIGKTMRTRVTRSHGNSGSSRQTSRESQHIVEPHKFRQLRPHEAYLVHVTKRFKKTMLPPVDAIGKTLPWFRWWARFSQKLLSK